MRKLVKRKFLLQLRYDVNCIVFFFIYFSFGFVSLCRGYPSEFPSYFLYCRTLRFDDKPDYGYLKRIFRDLFIREGFNFLMFSFLLENCHFWSWFNFQHSPRPWRVLILCIGVGFRFPVRLCFWLDNFEVSAIAACDSSKPSSCELFVLR